jgi:predicted GH43/DUF377 family glycosyl hydrolase
MKSIQLIAGVVIAVTTVIAGCNTNIKVSEDNNSKNDSGSSWMLEGVTKRKDLYPILTKDTTEEFLCPVTKQVTHWQEYYVLNPAAIVKDSKVYLVFRGEDRVGKYGGTSRLGLAVSDDGLHFTKLKGPVLFPDNDANLEFEKEGGIEDPRIVEREDGGYIMTYTAFDGKRARLCIASSPDLMSWKKEGLAFGKAGNGRYRDLWSKSGSIVCRREGEKLLATKINGKYWMYWGETDIYLATSTDLINWEPEWKEEKQGKLLSEYLGNGHYKITFDSSKYYFKTALSIRSKRFDSGLVEPGPPAVITDKGILLIYNCSNSHTNGDATLQPGEYTVGQALFDIEDPSSVIARCTENFIRAETATEQTGQMNNTAFVEGMVYFNNMWLLYYVTGEANIGVAVSNGSL